MPSRAASTTCCKETTRRLDCPAIVRPRAGTPAPASACQMAPRCVPHSDRRAAIDLHDPFPFMGSVDWGSRHIGGRTALRFAVACGDSFVVHSQAMRRSLPAAAFLTSALAAAAAQGASHPPGVLYPLHPA